MRIRLSIPDHLVTPAALEAALEATTLANEAAIRNGEIPGATELINSGVKWKPEPYTDGEHFDLGHVVQQRGWGDCDDLAPLLAGELRASGEDEGARTRITKTGKNRWHALVETSDGQILDPSRWAGMGKRKSGSSVVGVSGMLAKPFARPFGGGIAVKPWRGQWWARCDVPFPDGLGHLASHCRARSPDAALQGAVAGAIYCGEQIESPLVEDARDAGLLMLTDVKDLLADDGEVGSLFGSILNVVKKAANPMSLLNPIAHKAGLPNIDPLSAMKGPAGRMAANMIVPGAGGMMHDSLISSLAHGAGRGGVPGAIRDPRSGAVSVPLADIPDDHDGPHVQQPFIFYHPLGAPGPVVMRF